MTGPEHYREAQDLLDGLVRLSNDDLARPEVVARAQVHATLALVAVTVEVAAEQNGPSGTHQAAAWVEAVST